MYKLQKNKTTNEFELIEISSDLVIFSSKNYNEINKLYVFYRKGKIGFEGWTPPFILNKMPELGKPANEPQ